MRRIPALVIGTAVVTAFCGALVVTKMLADPEPARATTPSASAARTSFPGLAPASSQPQLPALETLHPAARTVVQAAGPFDERLTMSGLAFNGRSVTGRALVTSDVSDILEFEVLAGFYDHHGQLLETARFVYHLTEEGPGHEHVGPPDELTRFTIEVPAEIRGRAVSAAVGVPVLVNE